MSARILGRRALHVKGEPFPMGYESEEGGVIPTGYESERVAGIDHDATHGDPHERRTVTNPGTAAGLFGRDNGGRFRGRRGGALPLHRSHGAPLQLPAPEAGAEDRGTKV